MTFLAKPLRYDRDQTVAAILAIPDVVPSPSWDPQGVTWHNTALPSRRQWLAYSPAQRQSWPANYEAFCRDTQHWHSGPHLFAAPEYTAVMCELTRDGVHCSCNNHTHFGIETLGNIEVGGDDPHSPEIAAAIANAANAIAALCVRYGWDPHARVSFHRDCKNDRHSCPGSLLPNDVALGMVVARVAEIKAGVAAKTVVAGNAVPLTDEHPHADTPIDYTLEITPWPAFDPSLPFFKTGAQFYNAWKSLGVPNAFALGALGNEEAETTMRPWLVGDHGQAHGAHQMHDDRCALVLAGTGVDVKTDFDPAAQVYAAWWELQHTEHRARDAMLAAKTAAEAGSAMCRLYERAGAPHQPEKRGAMAERWAVLLSSPEGVKLLADNPLAVVPANYSPKPKAEKHVSDKPSKVDEVAAAAAANKAAEDAANAKIAEAAIARAADEAAVLAAIEAAAAQREGALTGKAAIDALAGADTGAPADTVVDPAAPRDLVAEAFDGRPDHPHFRLFREDPAVEAVHALSGHVQVLGDGHLGQEVVLAPQQPPVPNPPGVGAVIPPHVDVVKL